MVKRSLKKATLWYAAILALGLTSCVKDVIMDAKDNPAVAVACILSDDPVQELNIVYTKGASLKEAPKVMEAVAVLKDLTTGETRSFERQEDGVWRMDYAAVPEHRYRLEVTVPGYDTLVAEDTMPDSFPIHVRNNYQLYQVLEIPIPASYVEGYNFEDDPNYDLYKDDLLISDELDPNDLPRGETIFALYPTNYPLWIYAMNYNPVTGHREIADEICSDCPYQDDFNLSGKIYAAPQWNEPLPFPVMPQYESLMAGTNIKGLYPSLEGRPLHNKYIRIAPIRKDPTILSIDHFKISGNFSGKYNCPDNIFYYNDHGNPISYVRDLADDEGYVVCMAVSEVLDKYFKNAYELQELEASTDLSAIYLRDNFYANIKDINGYSKLGVFGCKIERKCQWSSEGLHGNENWPNRWFL